MPKNKPLDGITLTGHKDIFKSTVKSTDRSIKNVGDEIGGEIIINILLKELHPPDFHPFHVIDDEAMDRLARNIAKYGVREPGLVRPRFDDDGNSDGYELIAGNRRKRACELAGKTTLPVIIREMDDNEASIAMVDSNLEQREKLLYSEKAWAYRVKLEALNHSGVKGDKLSVEVLVEQTGESKNKIFRLVRLTELIVDLLDRVDNGKLAFTPAVELSYLSQAEQLAVAKAMDEYEVKPSLSQAVQLKKLKQAGELTLEMIDEVLSQPKGAANGGTVMNGCDDNCDIESDGCYENGDTDNDSDNQALKITQFRKFFPKGYTAQQMTDVITDLLQQWQLRAS
jgi:ParB family chromosome partitioning protein